MKDLYEKNEERFGKITSRIYSACINTGVLKLHGFVYNDIKKRIAPSAKAILDIGFGNGLILWKLAKDMKKTSGARLYGIDPSPEMLKIAKNRMAKKKGYDVNLKLGSSRTIPFRQKFDIIYTSLSYHHWEKRESAIPYILSRLSRNGSFIIYEYDKDARTRFNLMHGHMISEEDFKGMAFKGFKKSVKKTQHIIIVEFKRSGNPRAQNKKQHKAGNKKIKNKRINKK
ncbi:MAG: class I SAM-dependent methyltransferase [Candidatus Marsarchaeota archaeon]|nr:class I SAM-dependent methyltransferase [Candidatus Marsarchaeota archaeon]